MFRRIFGGLIFAATIAGLVSACSAPVTPTSTPRPVTTPTNVTAPTPLARATPTLPAVSATPTAPASNAAAVPPARLPAVHWSETQSGMTAKMHLDPYPLQLGSTTSFNLLLTDADGQAVTDANVDATLIGGMEGMEGEHDEEFSLKLTSQGAGLYSIRASPGTSMLVFGGMGLRIQRGARVWNISIPKNALGSP